MVDHFGFCYKFNKATDSFWCIIQMQRGTLKILCMYIEKYEKEAILLFWEENQQP